MNKFLKGFVCALLVLSTGCAKEEKKETPKKTKKKTEETATVLRSISDAGYAEHWSDDLRGQHLSVESG